MHVTLFLLALSGAAGELPPIDNLAQPEPGVYTAGQPDAAEFEALDQAGIRHVINLRPPQETPGFDERKLVTDLGLHYHALPIAGTADLTPDAVRAFDQLLRQAGSEPVLIHCASSNRVGALAALRAAWLEGKPAEEALATGRAWGLTRLASAVESRLASPESQAPAARNPRIAGIGAVYPIAQASPLPAGETHRLVIDSTRAGSADALHPTLEHAARALNLHALAGIPGDQVKLAVVIHGDATPLALNDAAWEREHGAPNPNGKALQRLAEAGVSFQLCGQAMRHRGFVATDIHPVVSIELSAMTALAVLQRDGYALIP